MSRALVTFGIGPHEELLEIALPSFRAYAECHEYELVVAEPTGDRPPSWLKVPTLQAALAAYDEVLWLDADVVIADVSEDIADQVSADRWQGLALVHTAFDGSHLNHGVWFMRRPLLPVLAQIWEATRYLHHPWWEQAASLELLGIDPNVRPVTWRGSTPLRDHTELLTPEWNTMPDGDLNAARFMHAAGRADRRELMRGWADARIAA